MYKTGVIINDLLFTPSGGRRVLSLLKLVTVNIERWADASFHFYQNKWKGLCQVPAGSSDLLTAQTAASDDGTWARWQHSCTAVQPHFLSPGRRGDTASIFLQISELIVAHSFVPSSASRQTNPLFARNRSHLTRPSWVEQKRSECFHSPLWVLTGWGISLPPFMLWFS